MWLTRAMRCMFYVLGLMSSYTVYASNVVPLSAEASIQASNLGDLLTIGEANQAGISFNDFSSFDVTSPLKILNLPKENETLGKAVAAKLIVIKASALTINSTIELIGPMADILFISTTANGRITCNGCELKNFSRATLAVASSNSTLNKDMTLVGNLQSQASGAITISNMYAPGIYQLELLANVFNITGEIDINIKVDEAHQPNINGKYTLGAGAVDAYLGDIEWSYDNQSIVDIDPTNKLENIGFNINAVSIKVSTSSQLNVTGKFNTNVDVLSASVYKGVDRLPTESIVLQAFSNDGTSKLADNFQTNGKVIARINHNLELVANSSKLSSGYQEYAVKGDLYNNRDLFAHNIKAGARNIINHATIEAGFKLEMVADKNLVNYFGGRLFADIVSLQTVYGLVRNGSRKPYIDDVTSDTLLKYNPGHLTLTDSETSELGTYYHKYDYLGTDKKSFDVSVANNKVQPEDTSAHISAREIFIKTKAFENINPYWEPVDESGIAEIKGKKVGQVSVVASEKLAIEAKGVFYTPGYLLNSSAIIHLPNKNSNFFTDADYIINQRYRNLTLLDSEVVTTGNDTTKTVTSRAYTYSPPGLILTLGNIAFGATSGFVNEAAFFEVYGDAKFYGGNIHDWGIEHSGISHDTTQFFKSMCYRIRFARTCKDVADYDETLVVHDTLSAPSLFLINGNTVEGTKFTSETLNTWEGFKEVAVAGLLDQHEPDWWGNGTDKTTSGCFYNEFGCWGVDYIKYYDYESLISDEGNNLTITWNLERYTDIQNPSGHVQDRVDNFDKEVTVSYIDIMIELFNSMIEIISNFLAEFKWWD